MRERWVALLGSLAGVQAGAGTHRHVGPRAHKGVGHGVDELPADPEVAQLDLPSRVDQDVGGLHVWGQASGAEGGMPSPPRLLGWACGASLPRCMIWCFSRRYARPRSTCGPGRLTGGQVGSGAATHPAHHAWARLREWILDSDTGQGAGHKPPSPHSTCGGRT